MDSLNSIRGTTGVSHTVFAPIRINLYLQVIAFHFLSSFGLCLASRTPCNNYRGPSRIPAVHWLNGGPRTGHQHTPCSSVCLPRWHFDLLYRLSAVVPLEGLQFSFSYDIQQKCFTPIFFISIGLIIKLQLSGALGGPNQ